jgi:hypothetical protein
VIAGEHLLDPGESDALVRSSSFVASSETSPTGTVIAASATQPSLTTPTSIESTSPRCSS